MLRGDDASHGFSTFVIPCASFGDAAACVAFESVGKGRLGAVATRIEHGVVPLVRTTTRYTQPAQDFGPLLARLAREIQECAGLKCGFNNALIERYSSAYTRMGMHSDQATDLADGSDIAIVSLYRYPESTQGVRTLLVESKQSADRFELVLAHASVVVFSLETNARFRHSIVLRRSGAARSKGQGPRDDGNDWLGITFRTSKTFVRFSSNGPCFVDGSPLTLANEEQRREFLELRRRENLEGEFRYSPIPYTISESDLLPPASP